MNCYCAIHSFALTELHLDLQGFTGPIEKALASCHTLPVCNYDKIEGELPVIDSEELSTDQKYFYDIFGAVISGHCSLDLSLRNPGAINHARWLTRGNRILRMYIGNELAKTQYLNWFLWQHL